MVTRRRWTQWTLVALAAPGARLADAAEPDDPVVYAAYLNANAWQDKGESAMPPSTLVLHPVSLDAGRGDRVALEAIESLRGLPGVSPKTGFDLLSRFKQRQTVVIPQAMLDAKVRATQPSASELDSIFEQEDPWPVFYERFPARSLLLKFSPVGYDLSSDEAAFVLGVQCGGLCGYGTLVRLRRTAAGWHVVDQKLMWVS